MPVLKASRVYGVPRQTLRDRVKNIVSIDCVTTGRAPVFTQEEEVQIVDHVKAMANIGYGYARQEVVNLATDYAVLLGKREKSNPLTLRWFDGFIGRWPELRVLKPRSLEHLRAKAANPENVQKYFKELNDIMIKYDLLDKPHLIFNVDEKGISQNHAPPQVVAGRDVHPPAVTSGKSSTTTIIGCGSAAGVAIPPYFVFPGARMRSELLEGTTPGTNGSVSETGWSNALIFRRYLEEHFMKFVPRANDHPVLLLMDGHSTHVSVGLIDWAKDHNILLFILPAHTSHILQPLDVGCFGPLQRIYNYECHREMRSTACTITRYNIGSLASKAYVKSLTPENLQAAFAKTGIFPMNKDAIDPLILAPSSVFCQPEEQVTNSGDNQTDAPVRVPEVEDQTPQEEVQGETFFSTMVSALIKVKSEGTGKRAQRKHVSRLVSGRCITEEEVADSVRGFVNKSTTKRQKGAAPKTASKVTSKRARMSSSDSQIAGPSGAAPSTSTSSTRRQHPRQMVDDSEDSEVVIREEDKCCVCKEYTPEAVRKSSVLLFANWGQCEICQHWVHLKYCTKVVALRRGAVFKCVHCL